VGLKDGWLSDDEKREVGNRDWHWNVCWLGTEYAVASHMIYEGMVEEGLTVCREGHERHHRQGLRYNHFECGEHYTRALDVWSVLLALQGFKWDASRNRLGFVPKIDADNHRSIVVVPSGWGLAQQKLSTGGGEWNLGLRQGSIELREVALARPVAAASFDGRTVGITPITNGARFVEPITLSKGQTLRIQFASAQNGEYTQ